MPRSKTPGLPKSARGGQRICPLCWEVPNKKDATTNGYHIECAKIVSEMFMDARHYKTGRLYELLYPDRVQPRSQSAGHPEDGGPAS